MRKHTREGAKLTQTVRYLILTFNIFVDEVLPFIQYLPRSKRLQSSPANNFSALLDKFHDKSKDENLGEEGLNDYEGLVSTKSRLERVHIRELPNQDDDGNESARELTQTSRRVRRSMGSRHRQKYKRFK